VLVDEELIAAIYDKAIPTDINNAVDFGRQQYVQYTDTGSDQEAKDFFLNAVMNYILNHLKQQQHAIISALMLLRERSIGTPLRSNTAQDFYSEFLSLPSRPTEMIADKIAEISQENRKNFTPQRLKFPPVDHYEKWYPRKITIPKVLIDTSRMDQFLSLSDKLQKQVIRIENILTYSLNYRNKNVRDNVFIQIFDEMYNLSISTYDINIKIITIFIIIFINKYVNNLSISKYDINIRI
jgi:hypothetical protein